MNQLQIRNLNKWKENLQKVKIYIDEKKERPSSLDEKKETKSLAKWLDHSNCNFENKSRIMKNDEVRGLWNDFINEPKYKTYLFQEGIWEIRFQQIKNYIDINNNRPSSKDKNAEIASLGCWIVAESKNYDIDISKCKGCMKYKNIHNMWSDFIIDPLYISYFVDSIELWKEKLQIVKKYIDDNKKLPSSSSKNNEIKQLGVWIVNQKRKYDIDIEKCEEGMKIKEIYDLWNDFINDIKYKKLISYGSDRWKIYLQDVRNYIEKYNTLPPACGITKKLGKWIQTQNENYNVDISKSKQIIIEKEIHQLWKDFINYEMNKIELWRNKTEAKLYTILKNIYPTIIVQFKQDWCKKVKRLPYDFCIPEYKIIIELDGLQHFQQISCWLSPEEQYKNDKYKEKCANDNNYSVIRVLQDDVLNDRYDWYKELCDAIEEIKNGDEIVNIYLCKNGEYDKF